MPHMYILECCDGTFYTGSTVDLEKRLTQHQACEGANYTRKRLPVKLVYTEEYERVEHAFRREKQVQGWSHAKKKALVEEQPESLPDLAKNYTQYGRPDAVLRQAQQPQDTPVTEPVEVTGSKKNLKELGFV